MRHVDVPRILALWVLAFGIQACGVEARAPGGSADATGGGGGEGAGEGGGAGGGPGGGAVVTNPLENPAEGPPAGNADATCVIPAEAGLEDVSAPTTVVGTGTPESCTGSAFVEAVALGGAITFDCGPDPVTITLSETANVYNDAIPDVVIDGGGRVTLSGGGTTRILYMNTCDEALHWTTDHCDDQDHPRLTVQNITFADGHDEGESLTDGGGAIFVRGGRFKAVNTRFFRNTCSPVGQDVGGGALRVLGQYAGLPAYVVNSTFGGADGLGNSCSNGGGLGSIHVSWTVVNSVFSHNEATGYGGNPADQDTPGGGSGGAIYNDGATMTLSICGTRIEENSVNSFGQAVFFVSNNHDGTLILEDSVIRNNHGGSWYVLPGISMHDDTMQIVDATSILE